MRLQKNNLITHFSNKAIYVIKSQSGNTINVLPLLQTNLNTLLRIINLLFEVLPVHN